MQIGVIGAGKCDEELYNLAFRVGQLIAERGHVLINGRAWRGYGGECEGSKEQRWTGCGSAARKKDYCNEFADIKIATDMGHARNIIIVHSSDALISVGGGYGTISEIAIALKEGKRVASLRPPVLMEGMKVFETPEEAVDYCISSSVR